MSYNINTFLNQLSDDDKNLFIYDQNRALVYTINPFSITNTQVRGNIITISIKSGRTILLDFLEPNLAKEALPLLQSRIFNLTEKTPYFIDKQIDKWSSANTLGRIGDIVSSPSFSFGSASFNNVIPSQNDFFSIGNIDYKWNEIYVNSAYIDNPQFDYNLVTGIPFQRTDFDRFINTQMDDPNGDNPKVGQDIIIRDANMYFDGTSSLRFVNFSGTSSHKLISVWDWDGPIGSTHTIYPEYEVSYNERAQLSFKMEDNEKSSVSLKSFDWTSGTNSGVELEYKFYQGDIILDEGKGLYSGGLKFSNRLTGTSEDLLTVQDIGYYFTINTQKYLSFERGVTVIISNGLEDFYVDDDYFDDATAAVIFAIVDSYDETTGLMGCYVERPIGLGRTASNWSINISGRQSVSQLGTTASFEGLQITGLTRFQSVIEKLNTSTQSSGITYDFQLGNIWYHDDLTIDFSADFVNVPTDSNVTITTNIIISQSATAYLPNAVTINGASQTIKWVGGTPPTGNANQIDVVGFSFINFNGSFVQTLAQLSSFA